MRPPRTSLDSLTALRGLAAFAVLLFHAGVRFRGYLAVDLFFILSGFVLAHVYGEMGSGDIPGFLKNRLARIYPVHLAVLILLLPEFGAPGFSARGLAESALLLTGPWAPLSWNGGSWSISCEWVSYLLFPALVGLIRACPRLAVVAIALMAMATTSALFFIAGDGNLARTPWVLLRSFPEFVAGAALYRLRIGRSGSDLAFVAAIACLIASQALNFPDAVTVLILPFLILGAVQGGRADSFMSFRPMQYLGRISYCLYMVQILPLTLTNELHLREPLQGFLIFVGSFALAIPMSRYLEYPARDWLRGLGARRPVQSAG